MPTRVVGTCCCGTPPFSMNGHLWVRIDLTFGDQLYQGYMRRVVTAYTLTYQSSVPAKWQYSNVYPDSTNLQWPVYSWRNASAVGIPEWDRTSLCAIGLKQGSDSDYWLAGGEEGTSLDPADWAALITDLSSETGDFLQRQNILSNNNPVGRDSNSFEDSMHHLVWTDEWSLPFTYDSASYLITFEQYGLATRERFYPLSYTYNADEDLTSASFYAQYELNDIGFTFSRAPAQNNGGSGE